MPYPWECMDCEQHNIYLVKNNQFYCPKMKRYVSLHERSCNTYFVKKDRNKVDRRPNTGCYITTAVCHILGYEDDCPVLETLRSFRDNYMKHQEYCLPLLNDYNVVGPMIGEKLFEDENRVKQANRMLNIFIKEAIDAIKDKEYDAAVDIYVNMTEFLMDYYEIDMGLLSCNQEGRQRIRES